MVTYPHHLAIIGGGARPNTHNVVAWTEFRIRLNSLRFLTGTAGITANMSGVLYSMRVRTDRVVGRMNPLQWHAIAPRIFK